jgi:hypothetical protein
LASAWAAYGGSTPRFFLFFSLSLSLFAHALYPSSCCATAKIGAFVRF